MTYIPDKYMKGIIESLQFKTSALLRKEATKNAKAIRMKALKTESQKIKRNVVEEVGRCEICGFDYKPVLQIHHIVPLSEFGNNQEDNIICVCPNCHKTMHHLYSAFNGYGSESTDQLDGAYGFKVSGNMNKVLLRYIVKKGEICGYFENIGLIPTSEE